MTIGLDVDGVRVSFVAPEMIDKAVVCDPVQKGRKFGFRAITVTGVDDLAPCLLKNILGAVGVAAESEQVPVQRVAVAPVKRVERAVVAILVTEHECTVIGMIFHP